VLFGRCPSALPSDCTLGGLGDRVPPGLGDPRRPAALAARRVARVSAAAALPLVVSLAWEVVPQDVLAARITMSHTSASAAPVASSALELLALLIPALCGFRKAWRLFARGVPCAPRASWLAALAPRSGTRVAATLAATLAWEVVTLHVLAAEVAHSHTRSTAALVSSGAVEFHPLWVLALRGGQATSSVGGQGQMVVQADVLAQCQERVLFAVTLTHRALRITLRDHEESKRNDRCECHFECHLDTHTHTHTHTRIMAFCANSKMA